MGQNLVDDLLILDTGNLFGVASTFRADGYVYVEHALQALRPGHGLVALVR